MSRFVGVFVAVRDNLSPVLGTSEGKATTALVVGLVLDLMTFRSVYRLSNSVALGAFLAFTVLRLVIRLVRVVAEGPRLDLRLVKKLSYPMAAPRAASQGVSSVVPMACQRVFITGGARGIGLEAAFILAELGVEEIVLLVRNAAEREAGIKTRLAAELRDRGAADSRTKIALVELDLHSPESVDKCGKAMIALDALHTNEGSIPRDSANQIQNVLVCNAGIFGAPCETLTTNWANHVRLIERTRGLFQKIVCLSSVWHLDGSVDDFHHYKNLASTGSPVCPTASNVYRWYGSSKLGMLFEAQFLTEEYGLEAFSIHPGWVNTEMTTDTPIKTYATKLLGKSAVTGAHNLVAAVINYRGTYKPGSYHSDMKVAKMFPTANRSCYLEYKKLRLAHKLPELGDTAAGQGGHEALIR